MKIQAKYTNDNTVTRNYLARYLLLIEEYELVKSKLHPKILRLGEFYKQYKLCSKTFRKYYKRFRENGRNLESLMPQKRGPKYRTRRTPKDIEDKIIELRNLGNNRYEIYKIMEEDNSILKPPSPSTIYLIFKRYNVNKVTKPIQMNKKQIITKKVGDLGHIDCHHLPKSIIIGNNKPHYLLGVVDGASRIAYAEVIQNTKSITVMFALLRILNILRLKYEITFKRILSDNGTEFKGSQDTHPVELLLKELNIEHTCTKPYRPQTNGKIERFWRTIETDLIQDTMLESEEELKEEVLRYLIYYNEHRAHQALGGKTPKEVLNFLPN